MTSSMSKEICSIEIIICLLISVFFYLRYRKLICSGQYIEQIRVSFLVAGIFFVLGISVFIYSITNIEKLARVFLMFGSLMATGKMFSLDL